MRGTATSTATTGTAAAAAVLLAFLTTTAAHATTAEPPEAARYCAPDEVESALSPLDSHMGKTSGAVEFRVRGGRSCLLTGAPLLVFEDARGRPLPIAADYPKREAEPARVDEHHAASARFVFDRIDGRTGEPLHGPVPARVAVTYPIPANSTTVDESWDRRIEVPGPVRIEPVQVEPVRVEPARGGPVQSGPVRGAVRSQR